MNTFHPYLCVWSLNKQNKVQGIPNWFLVYRIFYLTKLPGSENIYWVVEISWDKSRFQNLSPTLESNSTSTKAFDWNWGKYEDSYTILSFMRSISRFFFPYFPQWLWLCPQTSDKTWRSWWNTHLLIHAFKNSLALSS